MKVFIITTSLFFSIFSMAQTFAHGNERVRQLNSSEGKVSEIQSFLTKIKEGLIELDQLNLYEQIAVGTLTSTLIAKNSGGKITAFSKLLSLPTLAALTASKGYNLQTEWDALTSEEKIKEISLICFYMLAGLSIVKL